MGPQRKEQETSIQQNSSQEAHPVSSGQLLAHQSEPRKPRFSRRTLAIGGVGVLGALFVGRQAGILANDEEKQKMRLLKWDRALIALEPDEKFDAGYVDRGSAAGFMIYTAYERNGRYVPATEERAAQNVPYPILQPGIDEYSRGGFYTFQAYFYAALNYFYYTGDTKPLSKVVTPEKVVSKEILEMYQRNLGWIVSAQDLYQVRIRIPGIGTRSKNRRKIYQYQGSTFIPEDAFSCVRQTGEKLPINKFLKTGEEEYVFLYAEHLRGRWVLVEDDKDATPLYPPGFSPEGLEV